MPFDESTKRCVLPCLHGSNLPFLTALRRGCGPPSRSGRPLRQRRHQGCPSSVSSTAIRRCPGAGPPAEAFGDQPAAPHTGEEPSAYGAIRCRKPGVTHSSSGLKTQGADHDEVWRWVCERLDDFLRNHKPAAVTLLLAPEPPRVRQRQTPARAQNAVIDLVLASVLHRGDFSARAVGDTAED